MNIKELADIGAKAAFERNGGLHVSVNPASNFYETESSAREAFVQAVIEAYRKSVDEPAPAKACKSVYVEIEELKELHRTQLVAISTACGQNTKDSSLQRIPRSNVYWTPAYEDVCRVVDREIAERERAEKAESNLERQEFEQWWFDSKEVASKTPFEIWQAARKSNQNTIKYNKMNLRELADIGAEAACVFLKKRGDVVPEELTVGKQGSMFSQQKEAREAFVQAVLDAIDYKLPKEIGFLGMIQDH